MFSIPKFSIRIYNKQRCSVKHSIHLINLLTPNDPYMGRTAPLTSKRCILYIYSTNIGTEYFKNALYSPIFFLQNAVCFIMLTCLVPVLFTFYIQDVLKLKKNNSGAKGLIYLLTLGYVFRSTRNHHQALSKNTKIHYIKLLKSVLGSQTFTMNFWLWYICLCYCYSIWIFVSILF